MTTLDRREAILERLRLIAENIEGVQSAERNAIATSEMRRPAIIILDGDEVTDEGLALPSGSFPVPWLQPEIHIVIGAKVADAGTKLNALRLALLVAIPADAEIKALIGTNGSLRYLGLLTSFAWGRDMNGEMVLRYRIKYPLLARDLPAA